METTTLYVLAGPNGIGKTTSTYDLVPRTIPVINSDEIAKQVKLAGIAADINTQEYSNREASKLVQDNIDKHISFGIETNLCDVETWKVLIGIRKIGYMVNLIFLSTDNIEILNKRIEERSQRGEHFVTPTVVEERYNNSLKLLDHYFDIPDKIQLIDNSENTLLILEKIADKIKILSDQLPEWVNKYLGKHLSGKEDKVLQAKDFSTREDVKRMYQETLKKK